MIFAFAAGAFCATLLGGLFALRLKDRLHLVLGFSAGAVIGVAFFDLIPESIKLAGDVYDISTTLSVIGLGFVAYLIVDRFIALHSHTVHDEHAHHRRGGIGAATLSFHSFLDGVGIGLAFQASAVVGLVVAIAVLAHDFSDGINTVNMVLKHSGERARALKWLFLDAVAPFVGVVATLFFTLPPAQLGLVLALFAGFFLYLGASDLLPESHHEHPVYWTTICTVLGVAMLYAIVQLAS